MAKSLTGYCLSYCSGTGLGKPLRTTDKAYEFRAASGAPLFKSPLVIDAWTQHPVAFASHATWGPVAVRSLAGMPSRRLFVCSPTATVRLLCPAALSGPKALKARADSRNRARIPLIDCDCCLRSTNQAQHLPIWQFMRDGTPCAVCDKMLPSRLPRSKARGSGRQVDQRGASDG